MSLPNIRNIIFDLGGVLIDWNPRYVYRQIFQTEAEIDYFLTHICRSDWNHQQDAGRSLAEATEELVAQHPEWEREIRAFYGRWEEMLGGPLVETVELLDALRRSGSYRLLALTNWSAETFPVALARYDFLQWFEGIVVSGVEKLAKPDERIYRLLLERYGLEASESLFIDDNPPNVAAAEGLGIRAIRFHSPMQLREELAALLVKR